MSSALSWSPSFVDYRGLQVVTLQLDGYPLEGCTTPCNDINRILNFMKENPSAISAVAKIQLDEMYDRGHFNRVDIREMTWFFTEQVQNNVRVS